MNCKQVTFKKLLCIRFITLQLKSANWTDLRFLETFHCGCGACSFNSFCSALKYTIRCKNENLHWHWALFTGKPRNSTQWFQKRLKFAKSYIHQHEARTQTHTNTWTERTPCNGVGKNKPNIGKWSQALLTTAKQNAKQIPIRLLFC